MKKALFLLTPLVLVGCSFGGFKPPPPHDFWRLHNEDKLFPGDDTQTFKEYLSRRNKDMDACGMDFVSAESDDPEVNLCMESKGWYLEGGPVCEDKLMWDRPICIKWRAKHSQPNVKPWGCKDNQDYPTCIQTGSQRK